MARVLVGVSRSNTFFGKVIRRLTQSKWNHSFVLYESAEWGGWWLVQVDENGVRKIPAETSKRFYRDCKVFESTVPLKKGLVSIRSYVGRKYDWRGIWGFFFKTLAWRLFGKKVSNPMNDQAKLFCSEFCMKVLQGAGIGGAGEYDAASASPGDVAEFMERSQRLRPVKVPV